MLEQDKTAPNVRDKWVPPPETSEQKQETEGTEVDSDVMTYNMTEQELKLQQEEEKYGIYMITFSYERDNLELDMDIDMDSNMMAYPYLD